MKHLNESSLCNNIPSREWVYLTVVVNLTSTKVSITVVCSAAAITVRVQLTHVSFSSNHTTAMGYCVTQLKMLKNNIKYVIHHFLILNIRSALIRIRSEMNDYNQENSIVFLMGNLTWSYGWCSTSQRVHCGLEYWWRRMSLRITDLQNPIWTSLHLVFVLSYIHVCIQVLVVYFISILWVCLPH